MLVAIFYHWFKKSETPHCPSTEICITYWQIFKQWLASVTHNSQVTWADCCSLHMNKSAWVFATQIESDQFSRVKPDFDSAWLKNTAASKVHGATRGGQWKCQSATRWLPNPNMFALSVFLPYVLSHCFWNTFNTM